MASGETVRQYNGHHKGRYLTLPNILSLIVSYQRPFVSPFMMEQADMADVRTFSGSAYIFSLLYHQWSPYDDDTLIGSASLTLGLEVALHSSYIWGRGSSRTHDFLPVPLVRGNHFHASECHHGYIFKNRQCFSYNTNLVSFVKAVILGMLQAGGHLSALLPFSESYCRCRVQCPFRTTIAALCISVMITILCKSYDPPVMYYVCTSNSFELTTIVGHRSMAPGPIHHFRIAENQSPRFVIKG
jgi:hypothetical protein